MQHFKASSGYDWDSTEESECFYCGESFPQNEMTMVFEDFVCAHCLDEYMQLCDMCGEYWDSNEAEWYTVMVGGEKKEICPECFDNYYSICAICGETYENETTEYQFIKDECETKLVCPNCFDKIIKNNENN